MTWPLTLQEVEGLVEVHGGGAGGVRQDQSDDTTHLDCEFAVLFPRKCQRSLQRGMQGIELMVGGGILRLGCFSAKRFRSLTSYFFRNHH